MKREKHRGTGWDFQERKKNRTGTKPQIIIWRRELSGTNSKNKKTGIFPIKVLAI